MEEGPTRQYTFETRGYVRLFALSYMSVGLGAFGVQRGGNDDRRNICY